MATNLLWYVLVGFLLGLASSTLWEWFYFRKKRLKLTDRRIRELEAKLLEAEAEREDDGTAVVENNNVVPTVAAVTAGVRTSAWGEPSYRSPGVFLESEELANESGEAVVLPQERPRTANSTTTTADVPASKGTSAAASSSPLTPPSAASGQLAPVPSNSTPATGNNFVSNTSNTPSQSSIPQSGTPQSPPDSTFAPRGEQPTPADALRAKRIVAQRTRQEVLAALRANSEAMQRGESFSSTDNAVVGPGILPPLGPGHVEPPPVVEEPPPLPPARQRWVNKPELTERSKEYPDDLSKIKGIGDVYKQRLYAARVYTWKQIAEADPEALRRATSAYPSSNVEEWHEQAQKLMEKFGRKEAVYSGPPPDNMTKILGIGPVGAAVLYRAGICTFEQLASTPIADLEALFPIAVAGDQPDFSQWISRATLFADEKHADE